MPTTKSKRAFSYSILDERESQAVMDGAPEIMLGFALALEKQGITLQHWVKDDELVVTFSKRGRLTPEEVASGTDCDPEDLEEQ